MNTDHSEVIVDATGHRGLTVAKNDPRLTMHEATRTFILLPALLILTTLLGGLRISAADRAMEFLTPPLLCLVASSLLIVLIVRSGLIDLSDWFGEGNSILELALSTGLLILLFTATVQIFNSILPESGLTLWIVGFCILWSLVTYLFSDMDRHRTVKGVAALFFFAFVVKYLFLANLTPQGEGNWLQRIIENPGRETAAWILDLPKFASSTGYIQFFTVAFYFAALYVLPQKFKHE